MYITSFGFDVKRRTYNFYCVTDLVCWTPDPEVADAFSERFRDVEFTEQDGIQIFEEH